MKPKYYMISDAAKKVDVESHVLRYWEEELALPIMRNEMGHRCYTEENILLFQNIKCLKDQGFALKAVRLLLPELSRRTPQSLANLFLLREQLNQRAEEIDAGSGEICHTHAEEIPAGDSKMQNAAAKKVNTDAVEEDDRADAAADSDFSKSDITAEAVSNGATAAAQTTSGKTDADAQSKVREATQTKHSGSSAAAQAKRTAAKKRSQASARQKAETEHTNLPAASERDPDIPTPAEQKLLQFQALVGQAVEQAVIHSVGAIVQEQIQHGVKQALADNNRKLVQDMSRQLSCDICEDLDGLLQEREQRDEERYRNLDNAIRERQRVHKEAAAVSLDRLSGRKFRKSKQKQTTHCALLPSKKR